jgi:hypothetical protein
MKTPKAKSKKKLSKKEKLRVQEVKAQCLDNARLRRYNQKIFYVYALLDPRKPGPFYYGHWKFSHEPLYVGEGKGERVYTHLNGKSHNKHLKRVLKKLILQGLSAIVEMKSVRITKFEAAELEEKLIDKIGRKNIKTGPLLNNSKGGLSTALGCKHTKEEKLAKGLTSKKMWSNKTNEEIEEINNKRSKTMKEKYKKMTDEEKETRLQLLIEGRENSSQEKKDKRRQNISIAVKNAIKNTPEDVLKDRTKRRLETMRNKSEEEKLKTKEKMSKGISEGKAKAKANRTDEENLEIRKANSKRVKDLFKGMSPEERSEHVLGWRGKKKNT